VPSVGFSSNEGEEIFLYLFQFVCTFSWYFEGAILEINTFLEFMNANLCCSFIYAAENRNYNPRTFKGSKKDFYIQTPFTH
jgi:hypothetical protein